MSTDTNKAIVRRYQEEVWSQGKLDLVDELVAADFGWDQQRTDPAAVKQFVALVHTVFPDFQVIIHDLIAEGDRVAIRVTHEGTHLGTWANSPVGTLPPTGKRVQYTAMVHYRLADNTIVEDIATVDMLSLLQQLGAIPARNQE